MLNFQHEALPARTMPNLRPLALIVDADTTSRRLCRAVLEDLGFQIQEIDNGVAAMSEIRKNLPDVILLGQQLRDVSGHEAGQWFQSMPLLRMTPIVILGRVDEPGPKLSGMPHAVHLHTPLSTGSLRRSMSEIFKR